MNITEISKRASALIICVTIFYACGTPRPYINTGNASKADSLRSAKPEYELFLIGDTGAPGREGAEQVLNALQYQLEQAGDSSGVVFLGDNIYQTGLNPDTTRAARQADEAIMMRQLQMLDKYGGQSFFLPGNHDWYGGIEGVRAQELFIEQNSKARFVPNKACPGPEGFNLGENWYLVTLDSQWWINMSFKANVDTEGCATTSRAEAINKLAALVEENEDKNVVIAFHHALESSGSHAGYYSFRDHIFPLTNLKKNLFVPLPLVGSIYPLYRKLGQSGQDIGHNRYQEFKRELLEAVEDKEQVFFAGGHEHSLGFYQAEKMDENKTGTNHFILSGSGSKSSYARTGYGAEFVYSQKGFAKLVSYPNGKVDVEFWVADDEQEGGQLVYVKEIIEPKPAVDPIKKLQERMRKAPAPKDTVVTVAAGPQYKAGSTYRFFWGDHYREAWTTEVEVPVLDFNTLKGGLQVLAKTGGEQSVTIIIQDSTSRRYVLRSVQKDPKESLPEILQPTFVTDITQDQISASHPFGSVITPPLADAAGVYHTSPKLYYIPKESGLDLQVGEKEGTLVAMQDFVSKEWFSNTYGKETKSVIDSDELWEQMRVGNPGTIDQRQLVKSRLFDMFIGDWDRHEGQWFWVETVTDSGSVYQPVPIDRDNAYFKSDGAIPWVGRRKWALRKFQLFDDGIRDIKGINVNAQFFDRWFINELPKEEWMALAEQMEQALTDSVISTAVKSWPEPITELNGKTFTEKLKVRRGKITDFARRYYDVLSEDVNIFGSDQSELFEIERRPSGKTQVRMYALNADTSLSRQLKYSRLFDADETDSILLYGFGGGDRFELSGRVDEGSKIRIIGGEGDDIINDQSRVQGIYEKTEVYDTKDGSRITSVGEVQYRTTTNPQVNRYEKRSFEYDLLMPLLAGGFNQNDGIFLGGGALYVHHGFRKQPFASKHRITGKVATLTGAFSFNHSSVFTDALGLFNFEVNTKVLAPNFSSNYFGLGNETEKFRDSRDFFGYRIDNVGLEANLSNELAELLTIRGGVGYEFYDPSATEGRFVTAPRSELTESDFAPTHFGRLHGGITINTVDSEIFPRYGVEFKILTALNLGLSQNSDTFGRFSTSGKIFYTLEELTTTIATRVGFATNVGNFNFYQANTLGGQSFTGGSGNLRGFLRNRFSGRTSLFHNTDIRTKLFDLKSYLLPASVGVMGFVDEGRVWVDDQSSDLWHIGYGGGVWVSPLNRIVLTSGLAFSEEETLFTFTLGFNF